MAKHVTVQQLADALHLRCLTPWIDLNEIQITQRSINRPEFQLAGFFKYFDQERVQITGMAENEYMRLLSHEERTERLLSA